MSREVGPRCLGGLALPSSGAKAWLTAPVIGEVLAARAGGRGYRAIAGLLGRVAAGTVGLAAELGMVRRCVRRFTVNAGRLRAAFTALAHPQAAYSQG